MSQMGDSPLSDYGSLPSMEFYTGSSTVPPNNNWQYGGLEGAGVTHPRTGLTAAGAERRCSQSVPDRLPVKTRYTHTV